MNDASRIRDDLSILKEGNRQVTIWYFTIEFLQQLWPLLIQDPDNGRKYWETALLERSCNIASTHIELGKVDCPKDILSTGLENGKRYTWLKALFAALQTSKWSRNGEAKHLLGKRRATHCAMSIGDAVQIGRELYLVSLDGFKLVDKALLPPSFDPEDALPRAEAGLGEPEPRGELEEGAGKKKRKNKKKGGKGKGKNADVDDENSEDDEENEAAGDEDEGAEANNHGGKGRKRRDRRKGGKNNENAGQNAGKGGGDAEATNNTKGGKGEGKGGKGNKGGKKGGKGGDDNGRGKGGRVKGDDTAREAPAKGEKGSGKGFTKKVNRAALRKQCQAERERASQAQEV